MPSFSEVIGAIVGAILLANVSGHGDLVWKAIGEVRQIALTNLRQDWGCPSIFDRNACNRLVLQIPDRVGQTPLKK